MNEGTLDGKRMDYKTKTNTSVQRMLSGCVLFAAAVHPSVFMSVWHISIGLSGGGNRIFPVGWISLGTANFGNGSFCACNVSAL